MSWGMYQWKKKFFVKNSFIRRTIQNELSYTVWLIMTFMLKQL